MCVSRFSIPLHSRRKDVAFDLYLSFHRANQLLIVHCSRRQDLRSRLPSFFKRHGVRTISYRLLLNEFRTLLALASAISLSASA